MGTWAQGSMEARTQFEEATLTLLHITEQRTGLVKVVDRHLKSSLPRKVIGIFSLLLVAVPGAFTCTADCRVDVRHQLCD